MTRLVQVAVAGDVEPAVEHDPDVLDDPPLKVLVSESEVDDAREAIEALSEEAEEDLE